MPDAETKARAEAAVFRGKKNGASPGGREAENAYRKRRRAEEERRRKARFGVVLSDDDTRRRGLVKLWQGRGKKFWDAWCRAWMTGLNLGVPLGVVYLVSLGVMAENREDAPAPLLARRAGVSESRVVAPVARQSHVE